jgi:autotransporter-associated beta strand protein
MKKASPLYYSRALLSASTAVALIFGSPALLQGQTGPGFRTWTGGSSSGNNWSDPANWGGTAPSPGDFLNFSGSTRTSPNNNYSSGTVFGELNISNDAAAFILGGNLFVLTNGADTTSPNPGNGSITNLSPNTQTLNLPITLSTGKHFIDTEFGSGNLNFAGPFSRNTGAIAMFGQNGGNINYTGSGLTNINGILGGWATFVNSSGAVNFWAALDPNSNIVQYASSVDVSAGSVIPSDPTANIRELGTAGNITAAANTSLNALMMAASGASTLTYTNALRFTSGGGIFRPSTASGNMTIAPAATSTTNFITAVGGGELTFSDAPFTSTANNLTINGTITNDGVNPVSVNVVGYVVFGVSNRYSGGTYITQGRVQASNTNSFGSGPVYIFPGGEAFFNTGGSWTNAFFISGIGTTETQSGQNLGAIRMNNGNNAALRGIVTLLGNARIAAANINIIGGQVTGPGRLELTAAANTLTNLFLANTNIATPNNYSGGLLITAGAAGRAVPIKLGANEQIPDGPGKGDVSFNGINDVASLDLNGFNETINGLNGALTANNQIVNSGTNASTLTFGNNNATGTFGGNISDGGLPTNALSLVKIGTGTETLQGVNTHIGSTAVSGGTLVLDIGSTTPNSSNIILNANGTLDVSAISPLALNANQAVTFNGGNLTVALVPGVSAVTTPTLTVNGSTNFVSIVSIPPIFSYPQQFTVLKATNLSGTLNFGLGGPLPPSGGAPYTAYVSNNVANNSVDIVVSSGPLAITWSGANNSSWDTSTQNWKLANGSATTYVNGEFAVFNDSASNSPSPGSVTLNQNLTPAGVVVSNNLLPYTLTDSGFSIGGPGGITKQGPGLFILDNATPDTYQGDVLLSAGTLQVGNNDTGAGSFSTNSIIIDNSSLVFARNDNLGVTNTINGRGSLSMSGLGILTLGAANSFTGAVSVVHGTLQVGDNSCLGSTNSRCTISSGATLDINGSPGTLNTRRLGLKPFFASGSGVGGNGAIINTGGDAYPAISFLTLQGDTTLGGPGRWDLRSLGGTTGNPSTAALSTSSNAYNLTKVGPGFLGIVSCTVDPALANIDVQGGFLDIEGNTTGLGNPANTLTIETGATLHLYEPTNRFLKNIVFNSGGNLTNVLGTNIINGPITVNGSSLFQITGTSLSINGTLGGPGNITKTLNSPLIINGDASGLTGGITVGAGNLALNGFLGSTATVQSTISGTGTNKALTDVFGGILPGLIGGAGTFTTAGLTLEFGSTNIFDLTNATSIGGGSNDLIQVNGDLNANSVNIIINPLVGKLADGSYRLINYTGALVNGANSFSPNVTLLGGASRYVLTLDYSTTNQINLVVSGGPSVVEWNTTFGTTWDTFASLNWSNEISHVSPDYFYAEDTAIFDDAPGVVTNITINSAVSPFSVTNNSSVNSFTFSGTGKISGVASITKLGNSTLTISTANDFTGPVTISGGVLSAANGTALGATNGATYVTNGGTLDIGGQVLGLEPVFIAGTGFAGGGALINNGVQQIHALRSVTMTGDATVGSVGGASPFIPPGPANGNLRWDIRAASTGVTNETGTYLSTLGKNFNLTKVGSNQVAFVSAAIDTNLGNIDIVGGNLSFQLNTTGMGNPTNTCTIEPNGLLDLYNDPFPFNKVLLFNGDGATIYNENGSNTFIGPVTLTGSNVFYIAGNNLILVSNVLKGSGSLNKIGAATLYLADSNAYTGNTLISTGRVALVGSVSLSNSPNITLGPGATLDVSSRVDNGLTLISGQVLGGGGTVQGNLTNSSGATVTSGINGIATLTVSGVANLQGLTSMDLASGSNDMISASAVYYGGTLSLSFTPPLALGNYFKLFNASSASYIGSFASITPAIPGPGLLWDTASLNSSGILRVTAPSATNPTNLTAVVSGGNLNLSWPGDHLGWRLKAQTNSLNTGLSTNWFDVENTASVTNIVIPINTTPGAVFYRMTYP